ncbi:right-handed parallel beta-helix repeat-containing protein [Pleurocapsa sp. PCC 7319]|uniref:right-handed parallel beta-helix repeat-containing protein n=1 Tax=Pleurocapsa sp. PCC 7319 TaxID=118161 RepID=UPI0003639E95|nr:right-handed parallel beta-helix repeat-containing protein [Pleurocapsa sp. PCC 7319]
MKLNKKLKWLILLLLAVISFCLAYQNNQVKYTVYDGLDRDKALYIQGMKNVVIKNSTFKNIKGSDGIVIENSHNVHLENVTIEGIYQAHADYNLDGIDIDNSTNITIKNSTISGIYSPNFTAGIKIEGANTANITIDNNHIYDVYGNGIVSDGCSSCATTETTHDMPVPGLKITDNLIHDTGKTPTPVEAAPMHGMYVKAQDAYIANNTVYNVFDGQGISIRSTAVVVKNKVWDTRMAAVGFSQMKPPGSSMKSVFEDNELYFTDNKPPGPEWIPLLFINWNKKYPLRYETITVRNNKLAMCTEQLDSLPIVKLYPLDNLTIVNNDLIDQRKNQRFFSYIETSSIEYQDMNSLNNSSCPNLGSVDSNL